MKKTLLGLLCLLTIIALSAPGTLRPNIELYWSPNPPAEQVTAYRLYSKAFMTDNWALAFTLPGSATNLFLQPTDAGKYYVITASNLWGESPFSATVWAPPPPSSNGLFQVR